MRHHCHYLSQTILILRIFLKFCFEFVVPVLWVRVTAGVNCIADVMFANKRPFSPESYLILKTEVCGYLMPPG